MAEDDTFKLVVEAIDNGDSFVLDAGAGSGKTTALVSALRYVLDTKGVELNAHSKRVACVTYTNRAADEIANRTEDDKRVNVDTIHGFLWSVIERYQNELRKAILEKNGVASEDRKIPDLAQLLTSLPITYSDRGRNFAEGRVSHDDVLELSRTLFGKYPKLCRIVADAYPYIFVDEYQDTKEETVAVLLDCLHVYAPKFVIGFFGDSMQHIYPTGVGEIKRDGLKHITKGENYRSSQAVVDVLNRMRPELPQTVAGAQHDGSAELLYTLDDDAQVYEKARGYLEQQGWDFATTKELVLTHKAIAKRGGFENLHGAFSRKSSQGYERLRTREDCHGALFGIIERLAQTYASGRYGEFKRLKGGVSQINSVEDKSRLRDAMDGLTKVRLNRSITEVLDYVWSNGLLAKPDAVRRREARARTAQDDDKRAMGDQRLLGEFNAIPYAEVIAFDEFTEERTPFSTQHGVKGEEYDDVLVYVDDKLWTQYSVTKLLDGSDDGKDRRVRTRNLFYVCCSRARKRLAVVIVTPIGSGLAAAEEMFGAESCVDVSKFPTPV